MLGIDSSQLNVVAAKEMKAKGQLCFRPITSSSSSSGSAPDAGDQAMTCVVRVPEHVDRDRVLFWQFDLPDLPPKLAAVDAVLVEDTEGRLGKEGLQAVCAEVPALLQPGGVCVIVLADDGLQLSPAGQQGVARMAQVRDWLEEAGLQHHADARLQYPVPRQAGGVQLQTAHAGVWLADG